MCWKVRKFLNAADLEISRAGNKFINLQHEPEEDGFVEVVGDAQENVG